MDLGQLQFAAQTADGRVFGFDAPIHQDCKGVLYSELVGGIPPNYIYLT